MKALRGRLLGGFAPLFDDKGLLAGGRPFDHPAVFRRSWPFAAVAIAAVALSADSVSPDRLGIFALGAILTGIAISAAMLLPWERFPSWLDPLPALLYIPAIAALRHGAGGAGSGLVPLYALPIVWVALYGTRRQLVVVLAFAVLATVVPIVAIGPPEYPEGEWIRALLYGAVGLLVGLSINRLVTLLQGSIAARGVEVDKLAAAQSRHRALLATANDAIVTLTPDGQIVDVNPAAEEMFRGRREELVGRDLIATLATPEEQEFLRRGMERITVEQDPTAGPRFGTDLVRLDGEVFSAEVSVGVVNEAGQWTIHAFARDISDRVSAERARQRELDDLGTLLAVGREMARPAALPTVRAAVCTAAMSVSDAAAAILFEPQGTAFVITSSAGRPVGLDRIPMDEPSGVATASTSGSPMFVGRLAGDARVSARASLVSFAKAGYWQPIRARSGTAAVLVVLWDREIESLQPRVERLLNILASEAEVALELAAMVEKLETLALHDPLTGLANRRTLDTTFVAELDRAKRSGRPLSVVMLDLDHFKLYNDEHGHQAGDALLVAAAQAWRRELRPSDVLARYGGEEFTAVLPDCDHDDALEVAERLRAATPAGTTASAGVATAVAGETQLAIIGRADAALFRAKQSGRNRTIAA